VARLLQSGSKLQETDVYHVRRQGLEALRKGDVSTAEDLLRWYGDVFELRVDPRKTSHVLSCSAVSLATRFKGRNELQLSLAAHGLAQALTQAGKRHEAATAMEQALAIRLNLYSSTHHSVMECRIQV
jgi:hypothetical protein